MRVLKYPGLVVRDVDLSQIVSGTTSTVGAIVGAFQRGPVNRRVLVSNTKELISIFGKPNISYGYAGYSAIAALTTLGSLWVTRVVGSGAGWAGIKINKSSAASNTQSVTLTAEPTVSSAFTSDTNSAFLVYAFPGAWGNNIKVTVAATEYSDRFSLSVHETVDGVDILRENYPYLSRKKSTVSFGRSEYIEDVVNNVSNYIRILDNINVAETDMPKFVTGVSLSGGTEGPAVSDTNISSGWDLYTNSEEIELDILISAGYTSQGSSVVPSKLISVCEARRDCFAIIDVPFSVSSVNDIKTWVSPFGGSSFGAVYASWPRVTDTFSTGSQIFIPPSGFVAQVFARREFNRGPWFAPAGLNDGLIKSGDLPVIDISRKFSLAEQGELQSNVASINYIKPFPGLGFAVWGQRTLHNRESALRYINIRRLLNFIERAVKKYISNFLFEQNNEYTRQVISNALAQFLDRLVALQGLYRYRVVCDSSNNTPQVIDNGTLIVDIYLQPTRAIEEIQLNLIVTRTGVDLTELVGRIR